MHIMEALQSPGSRRRVRCACARACRRSIARPDLRRQPVSHLLQRPRTFGGLMEDASITFFDIKEFGLYRWGGDEPPFGDISAVLGDLQRWAHGKTLGLTKTFDPGRGAQTLPAYFMDARRSGGDWLLSLWNQTPSTDGAVASIDALAPVGTTDITMNELEEGHIPGIARYFWFLPDFGAVGAIRFQHPGTGTAQLKVYLKHFMAKFSSYAVQAEDDEEHRIVGFRDPNSADGEVVKARARVKLELHRKAGEQQVLLQNANRIRKVFKKDVLHLTERVDRALWQKMLDWSHLTEPTTRPFEVKMAYEIEVEGLRRQDVANVIQGWEGEDDESDYGFRLQGENQVHWLGSTFARDTLQLDVRRLNHEMVEPGSLARELARHRDHLARLLR